MVGKNHLIAATSSLITAGSIFAYCDSHISNEKIANVVSSVIPKIKDYLFDIPKLPIVLIVILSLLFFYVGTLMPDIDNENSMIGRFIHIPVEHRTITHTLWVVIPFVIAGIWFRPLLWFAFGYFVHLFWDSFSACGVCWLYPITKYVSYGSGAKVKKHHFLKLYWAGKLSETIFTVIVVLLTIGVLIFDMYIGIIPFKIVHT